jgi:hypothetical protein
MSSVKFILLHSKTLDSYHLQPPNKRGERRTLKVPVRIGVWKDTNKYTAAELRKRKYNANKIVVQPENIFGKAKASSVAGKVVQFMRKKPS